MSKHPIVTTNRLKSALAGLQAASEDTSGFEAAGFESDNESPTPAELAQLAAIAAELATQNDGDILATRQDRMTSLLQSHLAENSPLAEEPLDGGGFEATFDTRDYRWVKSFWQKVKTWTPHPWVDPQLVAWEVPNTLRLAVVGDWGTGLYGAPICAKSIQTDPDGFDIHMHLGDVYYSGTETEIRERFLKYWPWNARLGHLSTNSNHEMYSGGYGLFDVTLPEFAAKSTLFHQRSTCFAIQNDHYLIVGLDTGYVEHDLANGQVEWLRRMIGRAGQRRVILVSHHQPYSLLESQGPHLVEKLGDLLTNGRIHAWYWGHEHRLVIYDRHPQWGLYGRCIGHGGMPYFRDKLAGASVEATGLYSVNGKTSGGITVPRGRVLDGPNPYLGEESHKYGPNGYLVLDLAGDTIRESYRLPHGRVIHQETIS